MNNNALILANQKRMEVPSPFSYVNDYVKRSNPLVQLVESPEKIAFKGFANIVKVEDADYYKEEKLDNNLPDLPFSSTLGISTPHMGVFLPLKEFQYYKKRNTI